MRNILAVSRALSDQSRIRILVLLRDRELCLCQVVAVLGLAASTVSKHMSILADAGLVAVRQKGRWRYFRRSDKGASVFGSRCLGWIDESSLAHQSLTRDARKLQKILKVPEAVFCRKATQKSQQGSASGRTTMRSQDTGG